MVSRVVSRRTVFVAAVLATAVSFYTLGIIHARHSDAVVERAYDAKIDAIRTEVRTELGRSRRTDAVVPAGTTALVLGVFVTSARIASSFASYDARSAAS